MSMADVQHRFSVVIKGGKEETVLDNNDIYHVRLFEDIYSYSKTIHIVTKDTKALHEMLPIVGDEKVIVSYESLVGLSGYSTKEFTFNILKINVDNYHDKNRHVVEIFGVDANYKKLHSWVHTRSYSDACYTYMDIARYILETIGEIEIGEFENCPETLQYFYNGLKTPIQCTKWLSSRCTSDATGVPGYVYYSCTRDSGTDLFNVISLETLLQQGPSMPPGDSLYMVRSHNEYHINNIISYTINRPDKQNMRKLYGAYSLCWDIKRKKYIKVDLSYQEALTKFTCLGSKSLFAITDDTDIQIYKPHLNINEDDEEILKNIYYSDWVKRYCLQQTIQCTLEGHSDRYAGGMIEIKWPSADDDIQVDPNMVGLFLVKSITHQWTPLSKPVYLQKMVLIKNGYHESDPGLFPAAKVNDASVPMGGTTGGLPDMMFI